MTKAKIRGIDFAVPVILNLATINNLEPLYCDILRPNRRKVLSPARERCHQMSPRHHKFSLSPTPENPYIAMISSYGMNRVEMGDIITFASPGSQITEHRPFQVRSGVRGLNKNVFRCLKGRPDTVYLLQQLLVIVIDPLAWIKETNSTAMDKSIMDCLPVEIDPTGYSSYYITL